MSTLTILPGDCRQTLASLPAESVQTCITSPPYYGLRDYGTGTWEGGSSTCDHIRSEVRTGLGLAALGEKHRGGGHKQGEVRGIPFTSSCEKCGAVFREVRRVLKQDGTCWVNLGDSYCNIGHAKGNRSSGKASVGHRSSEGGYEKGGSNVKHKDLLGIPWMVAFALRADGWYLRQDIVWAKPNPMPESATDRCTKSHEYLFLLSKSERYYFNAEAIKDPVAASTTARISQNVESQQGSDRVPDKTNEPMKAAGYKGNRKAFRGGGSYTNGNSFDNSAAIANAVPGNVTVRPQLTRAHELAEEAGLTQAHFDAIRACGLGDTCKNALTQTGTGRNDPAVQALADEAKKVLGGYYREFLLPDRRNKRSVWTVATKPYSEAHFATFPPDLIRPCILAGSRGGDTVLDPFLGSGTTAMVALEEGRNAVGCELNPEYIALARRRCSITPGFNFSEEVAA